MKHSSLFPDEDFNDRVAISLISVVAGLPVEKAEQVLRNVGGVHKLAQAPEAVLRTIPGVGPQRAAKIRALTEWTVLLHSYKPDLGLKMRTPADIANVLQMEMSLLEREELRVVLLDTKNQIIAIETLYVGSVNTAVIRMSEIFRSAITLNAVSIVLVHNHPSGDPSPSPDDVRVTSLIAEMGRQLDIEVLDHLVIGMNRYVSLKERGLAFFEKNGCDDE